MDVARIYTRSELEQTLANLWLFFRSADCLKEDLRRYLQREINTINRLIGEADADAVDSMMQIGRHRGKVEPVASVQPLPDWFKDEIWESAAPVSCSTTTVVADEPEPSCPTSFTPVFKADGMLMGQNKTRIELDNQAPFVPDFTIKEKPEPLTPKSEMAPETLADLKCVKCGKGAPEVKFVVIYGRIQKICSVCRAERLQAGRKKAFDDRRQSQQEERIQKRLANRAKEAAPQVQETAADDSGPTLQVGSYPWKEDELEWLNPYDSFPPPTKVKPFGLLKDFVRGLAGTDPRQDAIDYIKKCMLLGLPIVKTAVCTIGDLGTKEARDLINYFQTPPRYNSQPVAE